MIIIFSYEAIKRKKYNLRTQNKRDLLETCLGEGRKKLIRNFEKHFDKF